MSEVIPDMGQMEAAYQAAAVFRKACGEARRAVDPSRYDEEPDFQATDTAVQAMLNDCIRRNDGDVEEITRALCHGLGMVAAQQPDPLMVVQRFANMIIQFAAVTQADIARAYPSEETH